jgi:hypothetical protein
MLFEVDDDVSESSAASGVANPVTVLAMIHTVKAKNILALSTLPLLRSSVDN